MIANTKGMTGHAMGTGIEDVVAVKCLETGLVPPVANFKEIDPELGALNLSKGGAYPVQYALHLGAGFGSQIAMMLLRWVPTKDGVRPKPNALGYAYRVADEAAWNTWLSRMAGRPVADLEVVHRTLRVRDQGLAARVAATAQNARAVPAKLPGCPSRTAAGSRYETSSNACRAAASVGGEGINRTTASSAPSRPGRQTESRGSVAAPAPPSAPAKPATTGDSVKERILALMVEKTGYPQDMLDVDLDLEADLGVDTVKQAEMFAAIREIYNIPRDENRKLRDYPTLAHVIRFVYEKRPDLAGTGPTPATPAQPPSPAATPAVAQPVSSVPAVDHSRQTALAMP